MSEQTIIQGDCEKPKISAIAPWFGGKRTLASTIVAEFGPHSAYWEPFCGGMSILLEKPESSHEHVNDLHGDLINLARVIQDPTDGAVLYRKLRRVLFSEGQHAESKERLVSSGCEDRVGRAFDYFVMSWMGRNGVSGTCAFNQTMSRRFTKNGGHGGQRFNSAVSSIPAWRRRMRRVCILQADAFKLIESIADQEAVVVYCDPPYIVKGAKYEHDFESGDHTRLADLLCRFKKTRVVVSYYEHPRLTELYPGWTKRKLKATKALVSQGQRGKGSAVEAPEVLLINGPSLVGDAELFS